MYIILNVILMLKPTGNKGGSIEIGIMPAVQNIHSYKYAGKSNPPINYVCSHCHINYFFPPLSPQFEPYTRISTYIYKIGNVL